MLDLWLAIAHHLIIGGLVAILAMEFALIRPGITGEEVMRLRRLDRMYGSLAALILFIGIMRVTNGAKGQEYYMHNMMFWAKMAAFAAVGLLSVPPTFRIYYWWQAARKDPVYSPPFEEVNRVRGFLKAEAAVFILIPIFAAAVARGITL